MRRILPSIALLLLAAAATGQQTTDPEALDPYSQMTAQRVRQKLEENRAKIEAVQKTEDSAAKTQTPLPQDQVKKNEEAKQALAADSSAIADLFPKDSGVQAGASRFALQSGDYPKALERAEKAVAADPEDADALKTRAIANFASGRFTQAVEDAKKVLQKNPEDLAATGIVNLSAGRLNALPGTDSAGTILPPATAAEIRGLVAQAVPVLTRPAGFSESVDHTGRAETALKLRDYEAMHRQATAAIHQLPNNPKAYLQRGFASLFLKKPADALKDANTGLALKPDSAALLAIRAAANNQLGKPAEALADAKKATALDPKDPFAWVQKGTALKLLGEPPERFLADFKKAAELNPAFSSFYTEALAELGRGPGTPAPGRASPGAEGVDAELARHAPSLLFAAILIAVTIPVYLAWRRSDDPEAGIRVTGHEVQASAPAPESPPPAPSPAPAEDGLIGGHFRLGKLIGRGGMGSVYEAVDTRLDRPVAIKRMHEKYQTSLQELERFMAEAKTVAALKHPAIVQIHDVFVEQGEIHLVFELVDGENILQMIDRSATRRLETAEILRLLRPVCEALDYAHSKGIIHRDLKCSNIMVEHGRVKVMDFGLARRTQNPAVQTQSQNALGTPAYMAPEQHGGDLSRASDLYSLGVCAYEMLTGELPFKGGDPYLAKVKGRLPPVSEHGLPDGKTLDEFFQKALALLPEARFRNATEFYSAFEASARSA